VWECINFQDFYKRLLRFWGILTQRLLRFESTLWEFLKFEMTPSNFSKNSKLQEWMTKDNKKPKIYMIKITIF